MKIMQFQNRQVLRLGSGSSKIKMSTFVCVCVFFLT